MIYKFGCYRNIREVQCLLCKDIVSDENGTCKCENVRLENLDSETFLVTIKSRFKKKQETFKVLYKKEE